MITVEMLVTELPGLTRRELERWIVNGWVRPDTYEDQHIFHDIDVARARLIRELQDDLQVDEDALPIILSLLDQLYALRRQVKVLSEVVG